MFERQKGKWDWTRGTKGGWRGNEGPTEKGHRGQGGLYIKVVSGGERLEPQWTVIVHSPMGMCVWLSACVGLWREYVGVHSLSVMYLKAPTSSHRVLKILHCLLCCLLYRINTQDLGRPGIRTIHHTFSNCSLLSKSLMLDPYTYHIVHLVICVTS